MPKNKTIKKVLVIGSGPITIGQAAEFDYAGTQACQALKEEGIEVVLVNSNPATIMTDQEMADKIYIEPLKVEVLEKIINIERPDSLIAGLGGQTGLNLAVQLNDQGILKKYGVKVIGTSIESIKKGEDREVFKNIMEEIGQPVIENRIVTNLEDGLQFAEQIDYPVVVRPAYTMGGAGGGIAESEEELKDILTKGLYLSPINQVILEKSIKGWKEIEYEVMRDGQESIIVCSMENVDPVGIHTGDSIVVAPNQTLSDSEEKMLRQASLDIIDEIGVIGGCNVQLAFDPETSNYAVIEINPRVSRSSALASKATGYPIAKVTTKIALGYRLDEIKHSKTNEVYACYEPNVDYVVVKIPKWPFDKFLEANKTLGTRMMATGEVMAIAENFEAALLKGIRSLEIGQYSLEHKATKNRTDEELLKRIQAPDDERLFDLAELLRRGYEVELIGKMTGIDLFFLNKLSGIIELEESLKQLTIDDLNRDKLKQIKKIGFSDKAIGDLMGCSPHKIYQLRKELTIIPSFKVVDTCEAVSTSISPYYYSVYDEEDEVEVSHNEKVMVIGSGPIRIGQGIEFDYCCVHSVLALKRAEIETIMVNNNPETVSTDFDMSDKLYFEPLTEEDVLNIIEKEKPSGVILQFGGQTAIKLATFFKELDIPILGTQPEQIDRAEDREKFDALIEDLEIKRPEGKAVWSLEEGVEVVNQLGYPVLVRPSYVLGGQGMEIILKEKELRKYLAEVFKRDKKYPVLIDRYLIGREIEVDALCDGEDILIPGIMEHLERAGVHSGDSISIYPSQNISEEIKSKLVDYTKKIALALKVKGMINIQFIEFENDLYIIEVNPRSSRTVPYISKVTGVPIVALATRVMLGEKLVDLGYQPGLYPEADIVSVKVPVFSTEKLPLVEVSLGPEMRSTGEVLGIGANFEEALYKGFLAANTPLLKTNGHILVTLKDQDKYEFLPIAKSLVKKGFQFMATEGTAAFLEDHDVKVEIVNKIGENKPNILDAIQQGKVDLIINTPTKGNDVDRDGFKIRRAAVESSVGVLTSLDTVFALFKVLESGLTIDGLNMINLGSA
ncbi:carbamoyl-phosphate synthase large subunit [Amphibacillus indicireducens]|uniref:Carbamoyl phosphate synthase large chain n=1 Tax=Amphibacillus indicireducens TaxID=1076330 RepID=A0ABP7VEN6_9BACI